MTKWWNSGLFYCKIMNWLFAFSKISLWWFAIEDVILHTHTHTYTYIYILFFSFLLKKISPKQTASLGSSEWSTLFTAAFLYQWGWSLEVFPGKPAHCSNQSDDEYQWRWGQCRRTGLALWLLQGGFACSSEPRNYCARCTWSSRVKNSNLLVDCNASCFCSDYK